MHGRGVGLDKRRSTVEISSITGTEEVLDVCSCRLGGAVEVYMTFPWAIPKCVRACTFLLFTVVTWVFLVIFGGVVFVTRFSWCSDCGLCICCLFDYFISFVLHRGMDYLCSVAFV